MSMTTVLPNIMLVHGEKAIVPGLWLVSGLVLVLTWAALWSSKRGNGRGPRTLGLVLTVLGGDALVLVLSLSEWPPSRGLIASAMFWAFTFFLRSSCSLSC